MMGNDYAEALSTGLPYIRPKVLNLSSNRLSNKGAVMILSKLGQNVTEIDLSDNLVGIESVECIVKNLTSKECKYFIGVK